MNGNMNLGARLLRLENGGGGSGSQNKLHVYSTEEKVIGKWVDGREVYEMTLSGSLVGSNTWLDIGITIDNVDIFLTTDKGIKNPEEWDMYDDRINVAIVPSSGKLQVKQDISSQNVQYTFYAVIHYIKKS